MSFETLRELKAAVDEYNKYTPGCKVEFFLPQMFLDGYWSVSLIIGSIVSSDVLDRLAAPLQNGKGGYFLGVVSGRITMHIQ